MGEMAHFVAPLVKLSSANLVSMVVVLVLVVVDVVLAFVAESNSKDFTDEEDTEHDVVI